MKFFLIKITEKKQKQQYFLTEPALGYRHLIEIISLPLLDMKINIIVTQK